MTEKPWGQTWEHLGSVGAEEIPRLAAELAARPPESVDLRELIGPGDKVRVAPEYSVGKATDGWLDVVAVAGSLLTGAGFISMKMIVEWRRK